MVLRAYLVALVVARLDVVFGLFPSFKPHYFRTEPRLQVPIVTFEDVTEDKSLIDPGYLFIDPEASFSIPDSSKKKGFRIQSHSLGPLIYDKLGTPVWSGEYTHNDFRTQNTHPCNYRGEQGLCYTRAWQATAPTTNYILNKHYEKLFERNDTYYGIQDLNQHEFDTFDNGTSFAHALHSWVDVKDLDLAKVEINAVKGIKEGWIKGLKDGCFEEISFATGELIFRFCLQPFVSLDHAETHQAKNASTARKPGYWDYAHINSVDKNEEGDYLLSARYFSQVLKIAGPNKKEPGSIIWRIGGATSSFTFDNYQKPFRLQHDARFVSTSSSETLITVFDNYGETDSNGRYKHQASGKLIKVNNETMKGQILQIWSYRRGKKVSTAVGSTRMQPNGNALVGFGGYSHFAEYTRKGKLLYFADFMDPEDERPSANYRITKGPWIGIPKTAPRLLPYSLSCSAAPLVAYVSWNGATEVEQWKFLYEINSTYVDAGIFNKTGFETKVTLYGNNSSPVPQSVIVEALSLNGTVLGNTSAVPYIPSPATTRSHNCGIEGCDDFFRFERDTAAFCSQGRLVIELTPIIGLICIILTIELIAGLSSQTLDALVVSPDAELGSASPVLTNEESAKLLEKTIPNAT